MKAAIKLVTRVALAGIVSAPIALRAAGTAQETAGASSAHAVERVPTSYRWRVSGGILFRRIDKVTFHSRARADSGNVPIRFPGDAGVNTDAVGSTGAYANREYDDGFVRMDPGTVDDGDTWYWGYEESSQIVASDRIAFHRDLGYTQRRDIDDDVLPGEWNDRGLSGVGFFVQAERALSLIEGATVSIVANFSAVTADTDEILSLYSARQEFARDTITLTDTYDLMGIDPPSPLYAGTYDGPGPLLPNLPVSRSIESHPLSRAGCDYVDSLREAVDIDILTVGLGLSGTVDINRLGLGATAGPTINVVETDATYREILTETCGGASSVVGLWEETNSDSHVKLGAFCQVDANWAITGRVRVGMFGRYDWLDTLQGQVGPSQYDVDVSGFSGGAALTWEH